MKLMGIIDTFKPQLNPLKVQDLLENKKSFFNVENGNGENLINNPYSSSTNDSVKSTGISRITRSEKEPLIKLTNVWKVYQMGEVEFAALKGINLEIYEGEFLIVLGPSGSGKSTLMNLLGCLDIPSKGTVYLNSEDISELDESKLARIRGQMTGFIFHF
jgi:putative ABC transport system ATP-binding protein